MNRNNMIWIAGIVVLALTVALNTFFTVSQTEQAIILPPDAFRPRGGETTTNAGPGK